METEFTYIFEYNYNGEDSKIKYNYVVEKHNKLTKELQDFEKKYYDYDYEEKIEVNNI